MHEIDFHTHQLTDGPILQILNIFAQDLPFASEKGLFSIGLHPWHINNVNPEECFQLIEAASLQKNMIAIGECGLDRLTQSAFALQELYFRRQIEIAEKYSKPLIIHCVRAFTDIIKIKKEVKSKIPWIIHGFQGNQQTALQLIDHNFYFSLGRSLLNNQLKSKVLAIIPIDRLFFETDDQQISIKEVYQIASGILRIEETKLVEIVRQNFMRIFGSEDSVYNYLT